MSLQVQEQLGVDQRVYFKNYKVFDSPDGHDINMVGSRNSASRANQSHDWIALFYWFDGI